ncbi:Hint domain-containing protein [Ruegeria sp. HKCCD8929]|uniref:Hint domain-containing protein n=1 Tax=Ruegeria sp. HKCCD8929 TaxID=2683006 RepID=UPI001488F0CE|nr:Hint domain-containing protein [Ruegeria sp. HKCCD8929]
MVNQVVNSDFSNGSTGWTLTGNVGVNPSRENLQFSAGNSPVTGVASQTIAVVPDEDYDFSFEYGRLGAFGTSGIYEITYVDDMGATQLLSTGAFANGTGGGAADTPFPTQSIEIPDDVTEVTITFIDTTANTNSRDLVIDDVVLDGPTPPPICFGRDTLIETEAGLQPVWKLSQGIRVNRIDGQPVRLRGIFSRTVRTSAQQEDRRLCPVVILKGALGGGLPRSDLRLSRQHRVLVSSPICKRIFAVPEVLVPAIRLTALPGVYVEDSCDCIEYFHLLFDRHEIIHAAGVPSESLLLGPQALKALPKEAREEISNIFPEIAAPGFRPTPHSPLADTGPDVKELIARHLKNDKPIYYG